MLDLKKKYLYRMIHIDNIPHVLQYGITHRNSPNTNQNFIPIGDNSLINTRNQKTLNNGNILGEYIPFYFGTRMPMLYVIQRGHNGVKATFPQDIIYCVTSIHQIIDSRIRFVFTDGHAINSFSKQFSSTDIQNIETILDFDTIRTDNWNDENDLDKKRRMEAEFLLEKDLPTNYILGYICYNNEARSKLIGFGIEEDAIVVKPNCYF